MIIVVWILLFQVCHCHHTLLLNTHKDVRLLRAPKKSQTIVKDLQEANAIDYLYRDALVCWADRGTDIQTEEIACASYNQTSAHKNTFAKYGITNPEGIACDWLTKKLYWTDRGDQGNDIPAKIEVISLETKHRKILFWQDLDQPRGIAVDPLVGLLFWSDWGESTRIQSASMNGDPASRRSIVTEGLFWPNGVSLDIVAKDIYWVDGKHQKLEATDYYGGNRRTLWEKTHLPYPMALSVADDQIFWTDWEELSLYSLDRRSTVAKPVEVLHLSRPLFVVDVKVLDPQRQPYKWTPCEQNNGNCSHLCLLSSGPENYSCACPSGIKLLDDNRTCAEREYEFLLLVRWSAITKISLDTPDLTRSVIPLKEMKHAMGIDYDPVEKYFYWTDQHLRNIRRALLNGTKQETIVSQDVLDPDGIAVDCMARNLYWSDTGANRIEMMRLKTRFRKTVIFENLEKPRAVAVAPQHGWLFWSDWSEEKPKIERSDLDGANRLIIVSKDISWPNGLALDLQEDKVYWGDAKTDKIEVVNMDGKNRREILVDNIPHIFGLSLLGDHLYWTDVQRRTLERAKKHFGRDRQLLLEMSDLRGIKAVRTNATVGSNTCSKDNGGCDQFCIHKPDNRSVCMCQIDYELRSDNRTCTLPELSLILYSPKGIRRVSVVNPRSQEPIPIISIKSISAIDINIVDERLYWVETSNKMRSMSISRAFLNGSRIEKLIEFGVQSPESLAVDWLSSNLYWADTGTKRIEVAKLNGNYRRVLFWKNLKEPRNLILDPRVGFMFWSEWGGHSNGHIVRASMDGSWKEFIVGNVSRINGLTIDYADRNLYWTSDANGVGTIERSNMDGKDRRQILVNGAIQPYSITNNQNHLFWINVNNASVIQADKLSGRFQKVLYAQNDAVSDIRVINTTLKQRGWNACASFGRCRYLCLVRPDMDLSTGANCTCPSHYTMRDGVCHPPVSYLLFSQRNAVHRLTTSMNECPDVPLAVPGLKAIRAIDYDPVSKNVYWIDGKASVIRRAQENSSHAQIVVGNTETDDDVVAGSGGGGVVGGNVGDERYYHFYDIALEPYSKLLFWSCSMTDMINVTRINSLSNNVAGSVFTATKGEKPRNLALFPERGLLFWVDVGERPGIHQSRLNGQRQSFIETEDQIATSLAVDRKFNVLYFSCADKLYQYDLFEKRKLPILLVNKRVTGLAVMRSFLYWVDKEAQRVERFDKATNESRITVVEHNQPITDLVAVTPLDDDVDAVHPCSVHNHFGNCSHLCLRSLENPILAECACPIGLRLNTDMKTCSWPQPCGPQHFTCRSSTTECVPHNWRCDSQIDCNDESDEEGCQQCARHEFQCAASVCVPQSVVCDGVVNCPNGADEMQDCVGEHPRTAADDNSNMVVVFALCVIVFFVVIVLVFLRCKTGFKRPVVVNEQDAQAMRPLAPDVCPQIGTLVAAGAHSMKNGVIGGSGGGGSSGSYDRSHITGASSSLSVNIMPLNPPPSPTTTILQEEFCCEQYSLPPHPTPCSTFVCDESDVNSSSSYNRRAPELGYRHRSRHHHHHPSSSTRSRRTPVVNYYDSAAAAAASAAVNDRSHLAAYRMVDRSDYELPQPPPTPCSYSSRTPSPVSSVGLSSSPR